MAPLNEHTGYYTGYTTRVKTVAGRVAHETVHVYGARCLRACQRRLEPARPVEADCATVASSTAVNASQRRPTRVTRVIARGDDQLPLTFPRRRRFSLRLALRRKREG